jgi:hypothetical protein
MSIAALIATLAFRDPARLKMCMGVITPEKLD